MLFNLQELKAKLATVSAAVSASQEKEVTEKKAVREARIADKQAKAQAERDKKHLRLAGLTEELEAQVDSLDGISQLLDEGERALAQARKLRSSDKDERVAEAQALIAELANEKARIETDPDVKFFTWLRWVERVTEERPNRQLAQEEINEAIKDGLLREISGTTADEIQAAVRQAKDEGRQLEERRAPFFWIRLKPRGSVPEGEREPHENFRYVSGGGDFYARTPDGARKRLVFFALQALWRAAMDAQKARYEHAKEVKEHSHLSLADIANGMSGQAYAVVEASKPWQPMVWSHEESKMVPFMRGGKAVTNYGPIVVESPRPGRLRFLNVVSGGMFHPLRLNGAWEEQTNPESGETQYVPVEFKFYTGTNPRSGRPSNFFGLTPVDAGVERSRGQLARLRALLCLAGGLEVPARTEGESPAVETAGAEPAAAAEAAAAAPAPEGRRSRRETKVDRANRGRDKHRRSRKDPQEEGEDE